MFGQRPLSGSQKHDKTICAVRPDPDSCTHHLHSFDASSRLDASRTHFPATMACVGGVGNPAAPSTLCQLATTAVAGSDDQTQDIIYRGGIVQKQISGGTGNSVWFDSLTETNRNKISETVFCAVVAECRMCWSLVGWSVGQSSHSK